MKKLKLFYNPKSGNGNFPARLDEFLEIFQADYEISITRLISIDLFSYFKKIEENKYDLFVIAGGDGTLNSIVNAMMKNNMNIPLAVIPTGTVNDFASALKLSNNFELLYDIISKDKYNKLDVAKVNNEYFINVCSGGFVTKIPHKTDNKLKNKLGKMAYYLKGIQEFPGFKSLPLRFESDNKIIEENIFMFLVINSHRAGGFKNINRNSSLNDGKFELLAIKYNKLYEMTNALIDLFINKNLSNKNIIYFDFQKMKIVPLKSDFDDYTDIDGEKGPDYPLEIKILEKSINIYNNLID
ncbi:MAG: diacylglycerol/lipid kinase family protein [archaeon]